MSYPVRPSWRGQGGGRQDPFSGIEAIQDRFNRLLGGTISGYHGRTPLWHPDIDIHESADGWMVEVRLPGVAPEEVAVDVGDRELVVRAARTDEDESGSRESDFSYRLTLPSEVDGDAVDATMDHGLLVIRLPRSSGTRTRRIPVARRVDQAGSPDVPAASGPEAVGTTAGEG